MKELYKRYRPKKLKKIVGQDRAVDVLDKAIQDESLPHSILFHGPSGCGKTTLARILRAELGCGQIDFEEINGSDARGIGDIRNIKSRIGLSPMAGSCKIYLIDECHELTSSAQNAFLKMLEDTPQHVYFFLATTEPGKLLKTIRNRCMDIALHRLSDKHIEQLVKSVCKKESKTITQTVIDEIADASEGSARKSLVILDSVLRCKKEKEQLELITKQSEKREGFDLAKAIFDKGANWKYVAALIKNIEGEPESIRRIVLGYASAICLNGGQVAGKAAYVIECFEDNYYDSNKAGLVLSCYNVFHNK